MRSALLPLAARLVRAWTRVYTCGLPRAEQTARRAEIDSDLWELEHDPEVRRRGWAAAQVLARLLIGIPDDLAWRMDVGAIAHRAPVRALAAAGMMTGPRRVSAFGLSATIHVVAISAVMWLASHGPGSSTNPGRAARVGSINSLRLAAQAPRSASGPSAQTPQPSPPLDKFIGKLLQNRYSLSVRNGQLSGTGAQVLQSAIAQSRFVLLGEDHGLAQTPELGAAVCNAASPARFRMMAIEEGPLVAAELENWARQRDGSAQLAAFKRRFPESINVYNSREEFEMLQQCGRAAQGEFHLWGLNQEAFGAGGLILSRILESRLGDVARPAMRDLFQKNENANRKALQSGRIADLFMLSADDQDLARGAAALQRDGSPEARSLFASLIESHEIHRISPADYDNARRHERLMKRRLASEYARVAGSAATPPVLLKFGAFHVYRGLNPVRGHGIGNYVAELAGGQGAQSLHIRLIAVKGSQPIHPRVGQPAQLRPFNIENDPRSQYLQPMLSNRLPSDWTLFDLRPLRHDFNALAGATNPDLATLVFGLDMLVVVSEGTPSREIH